MLLPGAVAAHGGQSQTFIVRIGLRHAGAANGSPLPCWLTVVRPDNYLETLQAATATRRRFLTGTAAAAALALTGTLADVRTAEAAPRGREMRDMFTLGVASGDPLPDGVVIWTRLAPEPMEPYGGMTNRNVQVQWQVAEDEKFRKVVQSGTATARPEYSHTLHVDVRNLRPWRHYFYRFRVDGQLSPVGRTRTAPAPGAEISALTRRRQA